MGHKIVHIPTLKISKPNIQPINTRRYDAFIFTSANAVKNLKLLNEDKNKLSFGVGIMTEKI